MKPEQEIVKVVKIPSSILRKMGKGYRYPENIGVTMQLGEVASYPTEDGRYTYTIVLPATEAGDVQG